MQAVALLTKVLKKMFDLCLTNKADATLRKMATSYLGGTMSGQGSGDRTQSFGVSALASSGFLACGGDSPRV